MLYKTSDPKTVHREIKKLKPLNYNKFMWWRRFDTKTQPLPRGSKFIDRIKNGEYEFSHYYWQWKLSELEINELHVKYNGDIQKILEKNGVDLARRKRLIEDFEKDENARLKALQDGDTATGQVLRPRPRPSGVTHQNKRGDGRTHHHERR